MTMFAIPILVGHEAQAAEMINVSAGEKIAFVPNAELGQFKGNKFEYVRRPMLPGFVLLDAADGAAARKACRRARGLGDLAVPGGRMVELSPREESLISTFAGRGEAAFSEGAMRDGHLLVNSGALVGHERMIGRVSHRRKRAYVPVTVGGKPVELELGLRIVRKGGEA